MSAVFSTDTDRLAAQIEAELELSGYVAVVGLPDIDGMEEQPDAIWVFTHDDTDVYQIAIPAGHHYHGDNTVLHAACASEVLPGNFQSIAQFDRADATATELAEYLVDQVIGVSEAVPPASTNPTVAPVDAASDRGPVRSTEAHPRVQATAEERLARARERTNRRPLTDMSAILETPPTLVVPSVEELASMLTMTVKGQPDALTTVAESVVAHLHKRKPERPVRVMLVGPSGVGKSLTAMTLGEILKDVTDHDWRVVVIDGNQYQEAASVSDLLGASQGYVGHGQGSPLIDAFASSEYVIVLVDEIDKAHPDVQTALMGLMEHGQLRTRARVGGRWSHDGRKSILLFGSNQAAHEIVAETDGKDRHTASEIARRIMIANGMEEWIAGRHGPIAVYNPLTREAAAEIVTLEAARLATEFGLDLYWIEPETVVAMLDEADIDRTGARELRLIVERRCSRALVEFRAAHDAAGAVDDGDDEEVSVVIESNPPVAVDTQDWLSRNGLDDETGRSEGPWSTGYLDWP
jgi:ATP-dependent Clp protease ATP-binding subunit ClpA